MADEDDDTTGGDEQAGALDAEVTKLGGIRDRIGRARFNEQVRDGLAKGLATRAKKPRSGFKATEVEFMVSEVTDTDIEEAVTKVQAAGAAAVPGDTTESASAEGGAEAKGPIRDWFAANPELVKKVVDFLIRLILGS